MIPKVIHYCWFGGNPLPEDAKKYIATWRKFFPDYEIKEWNESNFDINCCTYVKEAYEAEKWAFVSDYARFWILYKYGGVYFDTDVEIIKSLSPILDKGSFMGLESYKPAYVAPGLGLAAEPGLKIYKEILDCYVNKHFKNKDGSIDDTTVVIYVTELFKKHGLKDENKLQYIEEVYVYPTEYFCPKDHNTGKLKIKENTYTIHHFAGSWLTPWARIRHKIKLILIKIFGDDIIKEIGSIIK